jgi:hypothetical protein
MSPVKSNSAAAQQLALEFDDKTYPVAALFVRLVELAAKCRGAAAGEDSSCDINYPHKYA